MSGREEILARVRGALAEAPPEAKRRPVGRADAAARQCAGEAGDLDLLASRLEDYGAVVTPLRPGADIAAAVDAVARRHGADVLVAPADLPPAWRPRATALAVDDPPIASRELDRLGAVLSGCALAVADTGTIALDCGPGQGRRALTLLPDLHVCVVRADQVVPTFAAAIARLAASPGPLTLLSGPSATSDIELERVEGVHGPRRLEVLLAA